MPRNKNFEEGLSDRRSDAICSGSSPLRMWAEYPRQWTLNRTNTDKHDDISTGNTVLQTVGLIANRGDNINPT